MHTDETQDTSEDNTEFDEAYITVSIKEAREAILLPAIKFLPSSTSYFK